MRLSKSWARQEYEVAYRYFRRGFAYEKLMDRNGILKDIIQAADYSYQAKDIDVHGWSSNIREQRFWQIKWRVYAKLGEIPF